MSFFFASSHLRFCFCLFVSCYFAAATAAVADVAAIATAATAGILFHFFPAHTIQNLHIFKSIQSASLGFASFHFDYKSIQCFNLTNI